MTKRTLTNYATWNAKSIEAFESKTDQRIVLDLGNLGFSANEISFKTMSDGVVKVFGKVTKGNPTYDADGNLDKFGHNAERAPFEVHFALNTGKYDVSTLKVGTQNGVTRVQAMKYGATMSAPDTYVSGSYKNPTYKARPMTRQYGRGYDYVYGLGFQAKPAPRRHVRHTMYGCPCMMNACTSYVVTAPYEVRNGRSASYCSN